MNLKLIESVIFILVDAESASNFLVQTIKFRTSLTVVNASL